jgi:hypothetical protein
MKCKQCGNVIVVMPSADDRMASRGLPRVPAPAPPAALSVAPPASMGLGGRPHVDPFAPRATEPAVGRSEDASSGVHHDDAKTQAEASFADLWDPTGARSLAPQTSGAAQQKGSGEAEDSFEDLYRDLDSPTGERSLVPLVRGTAEQTGSGEAEAPFADLSRDLDASTGERPLVPQGRGVVLKLAPTPAAEPPGSMAGPEEEGAPPAPPPAVAAQVPLPAKKPALAPRGGGQAPALLGAAVALVAVAGGAGWLYFRSGGAAPASAHRAVAAAPASRASPSPRTPSPSEPSPRGRAVSEEDVEVPADEAIAAKEPLDPRAPVKRKPADRQPLARKVARPLSQATAAKPPAAPAPRPESRPEPPRVAVATGPAPAQVPSAVAPAGGVEVTPAPPPQASNADLAPLDEGKVEATFALHMRNFEACVADARANEPGLTLDGRSVTITMTVNPNGKVVYPTLDDAALSGTGLGNCIKRESAKIQFPAFGGGSIRLRKSITLK